MTAKSKGRSDIPAGSDDDTRHFGQLVHRRQRREVVKARIDQRIDKTPMHDRQWFHAPELLDHCAIPQGDTLPNKDRRAQFADLMRASIFRGDFSNIIWNTVRPDMPKHVPRDVAAPGAYFSTVVDDLLISRADALAWLGRLNIAVPPVWLSTGTKAKLGPKPKYDPATVRTFVFNKMDYHGDFDVSDPERKAFAKHAEHIKQHAAKVLSHVAEAARTAGVPCETVQLEHDQPYEAIIKTAEDKGCDLIAMASHGRSGISAVLLGSVTNKVLTHTKIPVLVCH